MTFSRWLRKQTKRDDSIGDFARDARDDTAYSRYLCNYPTKIRGLKAWLRYLDQRGACSGAITACQEAWGEFSKEREKA